MAPLASAYLLEELASPRPLLSLFATFAHRDHAFLLDSGMDPQKLGRFSFAGHDPFLIFKSKGDRVTIHHGGQTIERTGDPFAELRALLSTYRVDASTRGASPIPFRGGAVGYFGYELCYRIEQLPCLGADDLALPDCYFMFVDGLYVYDHLEQRMFLSAVAFADEQAEADRRVRARMDALRAEAAVAMAAPLPDAPPPADPARPFELEVHAMRSQAEYEEVVRRAREHIFAGDVFEVCTTHRLDCAFTADPFELYQELRAINPAPFAAYLALPEVKVVCASPERYVRLTVDGTCETRPIKGTRPRGATAAEDEALRADLGASLKDRAENVMIVDLVRNDFGRVCQIGSVQVTELLIVEQYATVFQLVSTVVGKLEPGKDVIDLVRASFPGGSMTGAPKIEAMTIIDALEPVKRGIYSGSIGYLDFAGSADLNIVIRTVLVKDGRAYFQVGGAVVTDSDPREEYEETVTKARAMRRALSTVCGRQARAGR